MAVDDPERLEELQEELRDGVTLLADPLATATQAFGMLDPLGFPKKFLARAGTFLIDHEGVVKKRWLPGSYRLRPNPEEILNVLANG